MIVEDIEVIEMTETAKERESKLRAVLRGEFRTLLNDAFGNKYSDYVITDPTLLEFEDRIDMLLQACKDAIIEASKK